jgi:hypothetical protein
MTAVEIEMLKIVRSQLIVSEARLFDHVSTTFRWLMATLFAANGGAIIGLLGWNGANQHGGLSAIGWFAAGLVLSILMGTLSAIWAFRSISPIVTTRLLIDQWLLTGEENKLVLDDLVARHSLTWKTWVPSYAGGASLACLIIGMLEIACRL